MDIETIILLAGSVLFFVLLWLFVSFLTSLLSGWRFLAKSFAYDEVRQHLSNVQPPKFIEHLSIRTFSRYRYCARLILAQEGFGLKMIFLFPFHQQLFFPWPKIVSITERNILFFKGVTVAVGEKEGFSTSVKDEKNRY